jgi:hypothetical protein
MGRCNCRRWGDVIVVQQLSSTARAETFDDDDGIGTQARINDIQASVQQAVVGDYAASSFPQGKGPTGPVAFVWDDLVRLSDVDQDGLGTSLELFLGTSDAAFSTDSDGDGINDGVELMGLEGLPLPAWGANPAIQDVFVEVDWDTCFNPDGTACAVVNEYQLTSGQAESFAQVLSGVGASAKVRAHLDIGIDNPAPAGSPSLLTWGNWGGAARISDADTSSCESTTLAPGRTMFRLMVIGLTASTGKGNCIRTWKGDRVPVHEFGHSIGLEHGGMPATGELNYSEVYPSIMNYAFQDDVRVPAFSTASFAGVSANPSAFSESNWANGNTSANLTMLGDTYLVTNRQVDWNQDGVIQTTGTVKGRVNYRGDGGRYRESGYRAPGQPGGIGSGNGVAATEPALAWMPNPSARRLYLFDRRSSDGKLQMYVNSSDLQSSCSTSANTDCSNTWSAPTVVYNLATTGPLAAANWVQSNGKYGVAAFWATATGKIMPLLVYNDGTLSSSGQLSFTGRISSAIFDVNVGKIFIYGCSGANEFTRWAFNPYSQTFDATGTVQTSGATNIVCSTGAPTVAFGRLKGDTFSTIFSAVPSANTVLLYQRTGMDSWALRSTSPLFTNDRPALVFKPFNNGQLDSGQFFIFGRDQGGNPTVTLTQGNNSSGGAPSGWITSWKTYYTHNSYDKAAAASGFSAVYDPNYDTAIRSAYTHGLGGVWFQPLLDGSGNVSARDQDDYDMIRKNLRCGLVGACVRCNAMDSNGKCTTWVP